MFAPAGLTLSGPVVRETESADYGACRFALDGRALVFRIAKTTPTKPGQFFTLWKRASAGAPIAPLAFDDEADFVVVASLAGLFIFDRAVLVARGVFSSAAAPGKRALRIYPPASMPLASQAIRTQQWQRPYFLALAPDGSADPLRTRSLFGA
ncbi:MAG: MepB family protein [Pseudomonadota bacterium]